MHTSTTLSLLAIIVALGSVAYSVWKGSQETADAGAAWRANRRLEEASITHLRLFKTALRQITKREDDEATRLGVALASYNLLDALEQGRIAGLPRVISHIHEAKRGNQHEDLLSEWIMVEVHLKNKLNEMTMLDEEASRYEGTLKWRQEPLEDDEGKVGISEAEGLSPEVLQKYREIDCGQGPLIFLQISRDLASLSRRRIRRYLKLPLQLTNVEQEELSTLEESSRKDLE